VSLTVKEILEKTFKRSFKGYDEDEVDQFLDQVIDEIKALKARNESLSKELKETKNKSPKVTEAEETIMHTLVSAQKSSERILNEAARKAELVLDNAETTAARKTEQTSKELAEAERKLEAIRRSAQNFATSYANMVNKQAASFDQIYQAYFGDIDAYASGGISAGAMDRIEQEMAQSLDKPEAKPPATPESPNKPAHKELEHPRFVKDETIEPPTANEAPGGGAAPEPPAEAAGEAPAVQKEEAEDDAPDAQAEAAAGPDAEPEAADAPAGPQIAQAADEEGKGALLELHEINQALSDFEKGEDMLPAVEEAAPVQAAQKDEVDEGEAAQGEFKPKYDDYSWLYDNDNKNDTSEFELSFKDPKEKQQLKSLIDEVID